MFSFISGRLILCVLSDFQLSSVEVEGGAQREAPAALTGPAAENSPDTGRGWTGLWTSRPNDVSEVSRPLRPGGPHTLLHSCSVQMVKYLSGINASAGPFDEPSVDRRTKHSWSGQKIFVSAETMAVETFSLQFIQFQMLFYSSNFSWIGRIFLSIFLSSHKKERIKEGKKQKCLTKLCQHCFLIYLHQILEDVLIYQVLNMPRMTQRSKIIWI